MATQERQYVPEAGLIQRWGLDTLDPAKAKSIIRNLRDKGQITFVKLNDRRVLYDMDSIRRLEAEGRIPARGEDEDVIVVPPRRKRGRPRKSA